MERIDSVRVQQKEAEKLGVDGDAIAIQRISLFRASKKIKRERERGGCMYSRVGGETGITI